MNANLQKFLNLRKTKSHMLIIDLEANYRAVEDEKDFETIQIGYVKADSNGKLLKSGSIFVLPQDAPILNDFIRNLTGIQQSQVDA